MIYQPNISTASFGNSFSKVNPDHYLCTVDGEYYKRPVVDYQIGRYRISTGCNRTGVSYSLGSIYGFPILSNVSKGKIHIS